MQADPLDATARLREYARTVLADLRRLGVNEWEIRRTFDRHGAFGLHELRADLATLDEAKREMVERLMRAPAGRHF